MAILILAQHNNESLHSSTLSTIEAATKISKDIHLLIAGHACDNVAKSSALVTGITTILHADAPHYEYPLAEDIAAIIAAQAKKYNYTHILSPATSFGRNILPRVSALLDAPQISNVTEIIDFRTFIHPIYTGNALATIRSSAPLTLLTIRPSAFDKAEIYKRNDEGASIKKITSLPPLNLSRFIQRETIETERPDLTTARIVIAGGRALGSRENFKMIETLADKLGGAIGATRAAVDAGYTPNDSQIGQTGKYIAPDLYIGIGLSGAIQHTTGIKDAKTIVAINTEETAPICKIADYTLTKDLFDALPELIEKL